MTQNVNDDERTVQIIFGSRQNKRRRKKRRIKNFSHSFSLGRKSHLREIVFYRIARKSLLESVSMFCAEKSERLRVRWIENKNDKVIQ